MEKEEFFDLYKKIKNNEKVDLKKLDYKTLHRINTMLLEERNIIEKNR